ncbi:helix-turn-helix domain-containing protein [Streptomyces sp. NPDC005492]|uniref:helix-turn-helix domain-containing protein n=1 Tax=Streptomyces sp. NPDC005492 TaxID=3156883 RepID=UPI0033B724C5
MDEMNAAAAARRLGISEPAVRKMIGAGRLPNRSRSGPALVASADVDRVVRERRTEALSRHPDTMAFARQVRAQLWPDEVLTRQVVLADGRIVQSGTGGYYPTPGQVPLASGTEALRTLTPDAAAVFGRAAVEVAAAPAEKFAGACRFCFADMSARVHGGLRPTDAPPYRVLLGEPCPADRGRWRAEAESNRAAMSRLRITENTRRAEAERSAAQAEFQAARTAAEAAASRVRSAAQRVAAVNPAVTRQAAVQGRRKAGFTASGDMACGCSPTVYCTAHAALFGTHDRRAARQ